MGANVQAGKANSQTIGTTNNIAPTVSVRPNARVDTIDQSTSTSKVATETVETVVINEVPAWVILLLVIGWLLPTPNQIANSFLSLFRRK